MNNVVSPTEGHPAACVAGICHHHDNDRAHRLIVIFASRHPDRFAATDWSTPESQAMLRTSDEIAWLMFEIDERDLLAEVALFEARAHSRATKEGICRAKEARR